MEKYNINFASWFTSSSLNTVKHSEFGKARITAKQIKDSSIQYQNKLFKAIDKAIKNDFLEELTPGFIEFKSNPANIDLRYEY